jgi:hypothetical protein
VVFFKILDPDLLLIFFVEIIIFYAFRNHLQPWAKRKTLGPDGRRARVPGIRKMIHTSISSSNFKDMDKRLNVVFIEEGRGIGAVGT